MSCKNFSMSTEVIVWCAFGNRLFLAWRNLLLKCKGAFCCFMLCLYHGKFLKGKLADAASIPGSEQFLNLFYLCSYLGRWWKPMRVYSNLSTRSAFSLRWPWRWMMSLLSANCQFLILSIAVLGLFAHQLSVPTPGMAWNTMEWPDKFWFLQRVLVQ